MWSLADVTRDLERHENVFQELQHAIDYLDHAPAGFFSVDGAGNISYLNATLAEWLEQDLAEVGSGGLRLNDIIAGEGRALVTTLSAAPGEVKTEVLDLDLAVLHVLGVDEQDVVEHPELLQQGGAHQAVEVAAGHESVGAVRRQNRN